MCEQHGLEELPLPRIRKFPRKIDSDSQPFAASNVKERYRPEFFKIIDACLIKLEEYFSSNDLGEIDKLLTSKV